jgi:hypothetical protein
LLGVLGHFIRGELAVVYAYGRDLTFVVAFRNGGIILCLSLMKVAAFSARALSEAFVSVRFKKSEPVIKPPRRGKRQVSFPQKRNSSLFVIKINIMLIYP